MARGKKVPIIGDLTSISPVAGGGAAGRQPQVAKPEQHPQFPVHHTERQASRRSSRASA